MPCELGDAPEVRVWASGPYRSPLRGTLVDFKEHGKYSLMPLLGYHLASALAVAAGNLSQVTVVAVPSRRRARMRRGYDVVGELARYAVRLLVQDGLDIRVEPGLSLVRPVSDQGSLSGPRRRRNLRGAMRAWPHVGRYPNVIVVDDIVTTGSTAAEAVRALGRGGARPIAVAAVATTAEQWRWYLHSAPVPHI